MNLLPDTRKTFLARWYLSRLGVVAALVLAVVFMVHAILVIPSLVHVSAQIRQSTIALDGLGVRLAGSQEQRVSERVKAVTERGERLAQISKQVTASSAIRVMMSVPHPNVHVTSVSFVQHTNPGSTIMTISGMADTREALRSYVRALSALPYVNEATVPISAYAKETSIEFVLSLSGTFTP